METKIIEIRDSATFIPALAIRLGSKVEAERYLLARAGFGRTEESQSEYIVLVKINSGEPCAAHIDPHDWGQNPRTYFVVHDYLTKHWNEVPAGGVVDVEYILGIRSTPKVSEASLDWW